jgi:hypothetical protein
MTPLPRTAAFLFKTAELSGPWHSAVKLGPRTIAVRGTAIFSVAIRDMPIQRYEFERGIQYPPFYIERTPV